MAFDREQIKLTSIGFIGSASPGSEIWTWGLKLSGATDFDAVPALANLDMGAIFTAIATFHSDTDTYINSNAVFTTLRAAALGVDGSYLTDAREFQGNGTIGYQGANTASRQANQVALAISLRTVTSIGVAVRGRFYVPLPSMVLTSEGRIPGSQRDEVCANAKTMLDSINNAANVGPDPSVLQLMSDVGVTTPRSRAVTTVRVGDVMDTIRSRRNALTESYVSLSVVA